MFNLKNSAIMKKLIKKYPTFFGSVLLLGIICAVYLGLGSLGLLTTWAVEHFQLALTLPRGKTQAINLLLYIPMRGAGTLLWVAIAVVFVGAVCALVIALSVGIYRTAQSLGAWLSAKQGGSGVTG
ncbi:hypothetical protein RBE51_18610 [Pseudomonas taiwanensis]|uniref:hypothetical protein n=1 Tax=Pseudomonas taiwanensis TaxID=470150 RepID=UPI0028DFDC25|nr:hypothetical protein [Pseudomonas taiwanensis]MDT8924806.1 hypothetical protein [Pseudomonas taiwanensis]